MCMPLWDGFTRVVMFLSWAFFGAQLMLFGAHFAAAYEHVICHDRPRSLDGSFIRMRTDLDSARAGGDAAEEHRGPSSYPPPGRV